ncbi:hypothetical protein [Nostoc sp. UHCC 0252]|uniref:hypothetical protein n=1 Tax=Nostoc sp. UHCC 0252 TaxID=3110241 RepID=UPI002B1F29C4|nr:hypothetical protein [Nostoc sp. UHCC 0252]MEA5604810.1 hypothetical protein [Nostoc sp. UHCC 0252]
MNNEVNRNMLLSQLNNCPIGSITRLTGQKEGDLDNIVYAVNGWGQTNTGEFALIILMENSRRFVQGLMLENELDNLIHEYQRINLYEGIPDEEIPDEEIPVVICSMTSEEASELKEKIDSNETPNEFLGFQQLKSHFECIAEFTNHYDEQRDNWKPFLHENRTAKEIVKQAIIAYSTRDPNNNLPLLKPNFLSEECFGDDQAQRLNTWKKLRYSGGILIVDAVSLFCPKIKRYLIEEAQILANQNITIFVLSPTNISTFEARRSFEREIANKMITVCDRFNNHDQHCEIGIINLFDLERRLHSIIPQTSKNIKNYKLENNKKKFRESTQQNNIRPTGVGNLIFGGENS